MMRLHDEGLRRPAICNFQFSTSNSARGFSLIEAMAATALVGMGIAALMVTLRAATTSNAAGRELTQASWLAQEIREWTMRLAYRDPQNPNNPPGPDAGDTAPDDIDDLMNVTYSPPRDGTGQPIGELSDWSQQISLTWKDPASVKNGNVAPGASDVIRVNVNVLHHGKTVLTTGWLFVRRTME